MRDLAYTVYVLLLVPGLWYFLAICWEYGKERDWKAGVLLTALFSTLYVSVAGAHHVLLWLNDF